MKDSEKYYEAKAIADALKNKARGNDTNDAVINNWLQENTYAKNVMDKIAQEENLKEMLSDCNSIKENRTKDIERLINNVKIRERRRKIQRLASSIAAALIAVSLIVYNVYPDKEEVVALSTIQETSINKPHLILNDGKKVDITTSASNISDIDRVMDKSSHRLNYSSTQLTTADAVEYHTLITPSAYTYTVTLADGTEVTLNANSRLRYPLKFTQNSREVSLEGEAYFKVKKDIKPFVVNSAGVITRVYGTEFTVQAYGHETVRTILMSGSVGVRLKNNSQEKMLKPNQMMTVDIQNGDIRVTDVDIDRYTAWLTGYFRYDSEKIGEAIDELSRWYGVEFKFLNPENRDEVITALFEKSSTLDKILLTIEKATTLKFTKKGGIYIIE